MSADISKDEVEKIVVKQFEKLKERVVEKTVEHKKCICVETRNITCPIHK